MFYLNCYFDEYVFNRIQDDPDSNNENREAIKISVYVRSFEYNSKQAFHCFCQGLRLSEKDIYYVRPDLGVARFAVYQQSNTAPINRFQTEQDAQTALNIYKKTQPNTSFFIKQENVIF
ncbi:hypothetical protein [Candidatus Albibeggiatoa sp. nov. NOAA]|uniref:hypothetical protein n=1 Tax=Candidatus Albibeggiatoa sp. nov. NOAA TaxID=3162724 RepID=UPI0032F18220|nr:hypothetical protein [Thiotrichaceae bacterium]